MFQICRRTSHLFSQQDTRHQSFLKYGLIVLRLTARYLWIQQGLKLSKVTWSPIVLFSPAPRKGRRETLGTRLRSFRSEIARILLFVFSVPEKCSRWWGVYEIHHNVWTKKAWFLVKKKMAPFNMFYADQSILSPGFLPQYLFFRPAVCSLKGNRGLGNQIACLSTLHD